MRRIAIILSSLIVSLSAFCQPREAGETFLRPLQKRDSVLIGDQLQWGVLLKGLDDGTGLALPDISKGLGDSIDVVSPWKMDTLSIDRKTGKMDIEVSAVITSFEEGSYMLPGIPVLQAYRSGQVDTLLFKGQKLDVTTIQIDTTSYVPHDIKGQIKYPVTFREVLPWIGGALLLCALVFLAIYLIRKHRREKEGASYSDPPHIVALRKLDKLRGSKYWAPDKQKFFYTGVTDALREYIVARWGIGAMEMTSAEIFQALSRDEVPADLYDDVKALFERSDFVKFAKYVASEEENASVVPLAVRFVSDTYQEDLQGDEGAGNDDSSPSSQDETAPSRGSDGTKTEDDNLRFAPAEDPHKAYLPKDDAAKDEGKKEVGDVL